MKTQLHRSPLPGFIPFLLTACLTACSPAVYTSVVSPHPPRAAGSPVLIYEIADSLPAETEVIGSLRITDNGFSSRCGYSQVMQIAKVETNTAGGNGLHLIWHKKPSFFGSSCHQIGADMLRVTDSVYAASYPDSAVLRAVEADFSATRHVPRARTVEPAPKDSPFHKRKTHALTVDAGYSVFTSKFFGPDGSIADSPDGLDLNASYQITARSGVGGGIHYAGFFSSYDFRGIEFRLRTHYVAPEFVYRVFLGRNARWELRGAVGIGYVHYSEACDLFSAEQKKASATYDGFGMHMLLGVDYRLTPSVAIGISSTYNYARFHTADHLVESVGFDGVAGIARGGIGGGLRFYF